MMLVQEASYHVQLARAKDCAHVYLGNSRAVTRTRGSGGQRECYLSQTQNGGSGPIRVRALPQPEWEMVLASHPSLEIWLAAASGLWTSSLLWGRSISRPNTIVCPIPGLQVLFIWEQ